ncbi:unnamed protein product [Anisakis simplex]|uniref:Gem-associated protein 2 n=1 Tax=Anisakis simplex TaxID=6269 RepID=A0A0M3K557_ANISI|nr:unnamed protein product [Anisakis simplex]
MEQESFIELEEFDENEINMDETPRSAIHYLQQVAVSRKRCPQVVAASIDPQILLSNKASSSSTFQKEDVSSVNAPPQKWAYAKCDDFSWNRTLLQAKREKYEKPSDVVFPKFGDLEGWRRFCLGDRKQRSSNVDAQKGNSMKGGGYSPTPAIVMNLSQNQVNSLVQHLQQIFMEEGYSRELFQWFYSVLLVVEKPLLHDVCASLRAFAKHCRFLRCTIPTEDSNDNAGSTKSTADASDGIRNEDNIALANEFSLFIALISIYFEQKDLADHQ